MKHPMISDPTPFAQPSDDAPVDTATLELLRSWRSQDASENPAELRAAEDELAQFKKAMNDTRALNVQCVLYP